MNNIPSSSVAEAINTEFPACSICLKEIFPSRTPEFVGRPIAIARPCGHKFHFDCISRWLVDNLTCPLGRRVIEEVVMEILTLPPGWQLQMVNAAIENDIRTLRALLNRGADVNAGQTWGNTPLIKAALKKHTDAAVLLFSRGADDPYGLNYLGVLYQYGCEGLSAGLHQAKSCYHKSALKGFAFGMYRLGKLHLTGGKNFPVDLVLAEYWLTQAAVRGVDCAMVILGCLYQQGGEGMPTNRDKAERWYRKAIAHGNIEARSKLDNLMAGRPGPNWTTLSS